MSATQTIIESLSDGEAIYAGEDVRLNCPLPDCGDSKNKLYVSEDGVWHCFHCSQSGFGPVSFMMKLYNVSYKEAITLAKDYGYTKESEPRAVFEPSDTSLADSLMATIYDSSASSSKLSMPPLPTKTKLLVDNWHNPKAFPYFKYLHRRGVTKEDIIKYNISYCEDGEANIRTGKLAVRNSIVFITKMNGKNVYWNTRSIDTNPTIKSFNAYAKYNKEYSRSQSIFNYDDIKNNNKLVVCEGVFNAITVSHIDSCCGVATFGKEVTDSQLKLLVDASKGKEIYLFLDNDANNKIVQLSQRLIASGINSERIFIVNNPYKGKDANDLGEDASKKLIDSADNPKLISLLTLGTV